MGLFRNGIQRILVMDVSRVLTLFRARVSCVVTSDNCFTKCSFVVESAAMVERSAAVAMAKFARAVVASSFNCGSDSSPVGAAIAALAD